MADLKKLKAALKLLERANVALSTESVNRTHLVYAIADLESKIRYEQLDMDMAQKLLLRRGSMGPVMKGFTL